MSPDTAEELTGAGVIPHGIKDAAVLFNREKDLFIQEQAAALGVSGDVDIT